MSVLLLGASAVTMSAVPAVSTGQAEAGLGVILLFIGSLGAGAVFIAATILCAFQAWKASKEGRSNGGWIAGALVCAFFVVTGLGTAMITDLTSFVSG